MNMHSPIDGSTEPPANLEAEAALLGAILINNSALDSVRSFLEPEHFFEPLHQRIYELAFQMMDKDQICNPVTIKGFLPADVQVGELNLNQYLARLAAEAITVSGARTYGQVIHDMWARREARAALFSAIEHVDTLDPGEDILDHVAELEERLGQLRQKRIEADKGPHAVDVWLEGLSNTMKRGEVSGVSIAFKEVQDVLSSPCFEAGNLYGLLSSSGEGKTSLTLQLIHGAAAAGHPCLFLSYDQTDEQCYRQMTAQFAGITASRQSQGTISEKEFEQAYNLGGKFKKLPHEIKKCTNEKTGRLIAYARQFVRSYGKEKTPLVVIDHIKAITPEDSRAHEGEKAQAVTRILKAGALDLECAVLLLNQRNSAGLRRDVPRPIAADLFGGESARYDYDAIFYLYRFKKWYEERKRTAGTERDRERLKEIFFGPNDWDGVDDTAEIGCIKSRFGDPNIKRQLVFDAPLTLYKSKQQPPQEELGL